MAGTAGGPQRETPPGEPGGRGVSESRGDALGELAGDVLGEMAAVLVAPAPADAQPAKTVAVAAINSPVTSDTRI